MQSRARFGLGVMLQVSQAGQTARMQQFLQSFVGRPMSVAVETRVIELASVV